MWQQYFYMLSPKPNGIEKTNTLFISSKHKHNSQTTCIPTSSVMIDQNILEKVENAKLLGVFLTVHFCGKKKLLM